MAASWAITTAYQCHACSLTSEQLATSKPRAAPSGCCIAAQHSTSKTIASLIWPAGLLGSKAPLNLQAGASGACSRNIKNVKIKIRSLLKNLNINKYYHIDVDIDA
jgi:hypothetical protein